MLVSMSLVLLVTTHWKYFVFFFFQAEDGIRDIGVTGVQTCALPISSASHRAPRWRQTRAARSSFARPSAFLSPPYLSWPDAATRRYPRDRDFLMGTRLASS